MREIVKVRMVAGSLVVSLPQPVLEPVGLKEGDRVILEAAPPRRLIITKEGKTMTSTQHLEMEIDLLEKKKTAIMSDLRYKEYQYEKNMPCDEGMSDPDVAILVMSGLARDRDRLDVQIIEKRIQLYELKAGDDVEAAALSAPSDAPSEREVANVSVPRTAGPAIFAPLHRPTKGWYYRQGEGGRDCIVAFANAKGSSSMRPFDARDGNALKRVPNRKGDYQDAFPEYLANAVPLRLSKPPSLERECKRSLPDWVLAELQAQIKSRS
jgi:antitoxin component of MazEF toxin-antitoxin module